MTDTADSPRSDTDGLVSVVVPTHYRNDRLRGALESVAAQEYEPIETIVVDGAEDERARPVAEEFDATYVAQERDEGPQAARSEGAERADGEYVQFLDDDDRLAPSKIRKQVPRLGPEVGVVYCGMDDEERGRIRPNPVVRGDVLGRALEMRTFPCINSTMLIDRETIERVLPLRHRHGADDTGLKIDLALQTTFDFVAEPLVFRGRTGDSLSESWRYLDGRLSVIATYDRLYRQFPDRIRERALRETHYQAGRKLLAEEGWSPRATAAFARAAWETPDDYAYHVGATLGSLAGSPGLAAVDRLFDRSGY
ncbi:glycosyltransferase [Halorussus gelatinilyticus]|uniref:Glycosyltransferase n=1 Tax=Halorussus gelatinilyticus TaxID=2937524 RepID=A0A8U0IKI8_9EURY|nr:glycosyltransferase family 2 protein [Halorussus gelatinilyticus]UPW01268.1 glycosyltransferase [Halorussus gelatinilyticus]